MNRICLSENASDILKNALKNKGCLLIEIRRTDAVYDAVVSHCDIYLCKLGAELVVAPEQLSLIREELLQSGARFTPGAEGLGFQYPGNVKYNAAVLGGYLIHNTRHTDLALRARAEALGLKLLHVNQGYTKCSLVAVDEHSAITADMGLAAALERNGIDVLLISPGHVRLPGFPYGFLGGASGRVGDEIIFNGDLSAHPDFEPIRQFIGERGLRTVYFKEYPLEDIGSIIQF